MKLLKMSISDVNPSLAEQKVNIKNAFYTAKKGSICGKTHKIWTGTKHFATCKRTRHELLILNHTYIYFF